MHGVARPLDDKRLGLLARMVGFNVAIFTKRIAEPLLRRNFIRQNRKGAYEITPNGQEFVLAEMKRRVESGKPKITTWGGISMGNCVFIVTEKQEEPK
jgi:hypothetical protein